MTPNDIALKIAQASSGHDVGFADAALVTDALAALGYEFVGHGVAGRYHESDEAIQGMRLYLVRKTGLHMQVVRNVLVAIERFGLKIREPDAHPSGVRTTEAAFEYVPQSGAARAAAQKPIDMRMPGQGRNYA
jgi:hypothetical protein